MNQPQDEADNLDALREEYVAMQAPGWKRRISIILEWFQADSKKLTFGSIKDETERNQAIGRCQAFTMMVERDKEIEEAWAEYQREQAEKDKEPEEEGGTLGVSYEASQ